jgi:hypothetical protein
MEEYRRIAHEKYLQNIKSAEIEKNKEVEIEIELQNFYNNLKIWDNCIKNIEENEHFDLEETLVQIFSILIEILPITKKHDNFFIIEEHINQLVNILNSFFDKVKLNIDRIIQIQMLMTNIIELSGLDIKIEAMNTEDDEKIAQDIEYQELLNIPDPIELRHNPPYNPLYNPPYNNMKLVELKQLARTHGLRISGNKNEVYNRLVQNGIIN